MAAIVTTIFVVVAVWKPWEGPLSGPHPSSRISGSTEPAASGDDGIALPRGPIPPLPSRAELVAATTPRPVWGIRALVIRAGGPIFTGRVPLVERWVGAADHLGLGGESLAPVDASEPDDHVVALGVTTPDNALALDVRFWRLPDRGPPERLAPVGIEGPEAGSWLWLPDPAKATDAGTWAEGAYEIDVLFGPRIARIVVTIPSAAPTTSRVEAPFGQPPFATILDSFEPGPFALADGGALPLAGGNPPIVDEREAWLGPAAGLPPVSGVTGRQVTGFGRLFAVGDVPLRVDVREMAPRASPIETGINIVSVEPGQRQAIVAFPESGGIYSDGLYLMTVRWTTAGADRSASQVIEVRPQIPTSPPNAPLDAMARWVGLVDRPDIASREPLIFVGDSTAADACGASSVITAGDRLFGVVVPPGVSVVAVRLRLASGARPDVQIRFAPDAVPRLTVTAVPREGLAVGAYDLTLNLDSPAGERVVTRRICVSPT